MAGASRTFRCRSTALSNFTDISNIPLGMIEKVEVLSGSASAIYGSDAMAGVVNFVLKKDVDGLNFSYRYGTPTADGGGESIASRCPPAFHANVSMPCSDSNCSIRSRCGHSIARSRTPPLTIRRPTRPSARRDFLRIEPNEEVYIDPGQATCDSLSALNKGTIVWGRGQAGDRSTTTSTITAPATTAAATNPSATARSSNSRRGATGFASLNFDLSDTTTLFADVLIGVSKVKSFKDVLSWNYMDAAGNEEGTFFNDQVGDLDNWYRQFTPEEMGGLERGMIHNDQTTHHASRPASRVRSATRGNTRRISTTASTR